VKSTFPILLVEDNDDDVFLVRRAFHTVKIPHPLFTVTDGQKAIDYLSGKDSYADRSVYPFPRLVLADLKMPGVDGFDLIRWIRHDRNMRLIPIIILSSSALPEDVNRAYTLGASAYMVKPADPRALERLFGTIAEFWIAGEAPNINWSSAASPTSM
jgi:CheY-like chemotaxis protein